MAVNAPGSGGMSFRMEKRGEIDIRYGVRGSGRPPRQRADLRHADSDSNYDEIRLFSTEGEFEDVFLVYERADKPGTVTVGFRPLTDDDDDDDDRATRAALSAVDDLLEDIAREATGGR